MLTDATDEEAGVDLGIAGVAEAGPSTHEDNLIILHEMDIKGEEEDEDDEDEDDDDNDDTNRRNPEEEDDDDEEEDEVDDQQEIPCSNQQDVPTSTAEEAALCTTSDLDGFDGINAIKMETDNIFESGGKNSVNFVCGCTRLALLVGVLVFVLLSCIMILYRLSSPWVM